MPGKLTNWSRWLFAGLFPAGLVLVSFAWSVGAWNGLMADAVRVRPFDRPCCECGAPSRVVPRVREELKTLCSPCFERLVDRLWNEL